MTTDDVKDALTNYHSYMKRLEDAELALTAIVTRQNKTGGSIIKIPENPKDKTHMQLTCIEQKDRIKLNTRYWKDMIDLANSFIKALPNTPTPYREIVKDKYINRLCDHQLQEKYRYDRRQILRIVKRAIERYVEVT